MALTGMPAERASISDGLEESWPTCERPAATEATPSTFGPPGVIENSTPSSVKKPLFCATISPSRPFDTSQPCCMSTLTRSAARAVTLTRLDMAPMVPSAAPARSRSRRCHEAAAVGCPMRSSPVVLGRLAAACWGKHGVAAMYSFLAR